MSSNFLVELNKVDISGVVPTLVNLNDIQYFRDNGNSVGVVFSNDSSIQVAYTLQELKSELSQYLYNEYYMQTEVDVASYELKEFDSFLEVDYSSTGVCTIKFPDAQRVAGRVVNVKDTGEKAGTNNIIIVDSSDVEIFRISYDKASYSIRANHDSSKWYIY